MSLTEVVPERIRINLPGCGTIYMSLGTARDLYDELGKILATRVKQGKGLL